MTNIKKLTSILLAVIMALGIFAIVPITANAAKKSDGFYYEVLEDGTAKIIFYNGSETTLEIPSELDGYTVTRIDDYAFAFNTSLASITIPNSVTSIGWGAFGDCTKLMSVSIPDSVTYIGNEAFRGCTILTSVTIPDSVTCIGNYAFEFCSSLASITIGNSVTTIGYGAFFDCKSLTSVTIPDSVTEIGDLVFGYIWDDKIFECVTVDGFTIYGYESSEAERYSTENGLTFLSLGDLPAPKPGDVDRDKELTAKDATEIQKSIVGLATLTDAQKAVANVDGDDEITVTDATMILKFIVGIVPSLG